MCNCANAVYRLNPTLKTFISGNILFNPVVYFSEISEVRTVPTGSAVLIHSYYISTYFQSQIKNVIITTPSRLKLA